MGVLSFVAHTFMSEETLVILPEKERELMGEYPLWIFIVFVHISGIGLSLFLNLYSYFFEIPSFKCKTRLYFDAWCRSISC